MTFMDDLNLLSNDKKNLQNLKNITLSFLTFNHIFINTQKTKLIVLNSKEKNKIILLNNTPIHPLPKKEPMRILGIYLSK